MKRSTLLILCLALLAPAAAVAAGTTPTPAPTKSSATKPPVKKAPAKKAPTKKPTTKPTPAPATRTLDCTKAKIVYVKVTAEIVVSRVDGVQPGKQPTLNMKIGDPILLVIDADTDYTATLPGTVMASYKGTKGTHGLCVASMQTGKSLFSIDKTGIVELTVTK